MRAATPTANLIDVQALRVGMFVHLDVGWISHPFPLNSFKITSPQQVDTIRALGLERVRWNPQRSDLGDFDSRPGDPQAVARPATPAGSSARPERSSVFAEGSLAKASSGPERVGPAGRAVEATDEAPVARKKTATLAPSAEQRSEALAAQRATQRVCERQFAEAAKACKQVGDLVLAKPGDARDQAEALTRALTGKMLNEPDLRIRLLTEAAGDKQSLHAINVALISLLMGRAFGFGEADMLDLGVGAMLHDVGKVEMPLRVRHREETFTPAEQHDYEQHVAHGLVHAARMGLSAGATMVIAQHHEHADGSGFPNRLNTDRMSLGARIVSLVDRYDNLCNPYFLAKAMTPHEALSLLFAQGKTQYDTTILSGFIKMMGVYPPGSTVQLTDDRYAIVDSVNSSRPLKPNVLVYDRGVPRDEALLIDLQLAPGLGIRRSLKPLALPRPALDYLSPRPRTVYFFEPASAVEAVEALEAAA
jgi:HD-GYP domain-containing protein (c-di-GMP phosphodiesterase class II)